MKAYFNLHVTRVVMEGDQQEVVCSVRGDTRIHEDMANLRTAHGEITLVFHKDIEICPQRLRPGTVLRHVSFELPPDPEPESDHDRKPEA